MAERLSGCVLPRGEVAADLADRLFELFRAYYLDVDRPTFDRDLAEKDWVLLLKDAAGAVRGFTTMMKLETTVADRRVRAVFNGNTIIEEECWGDQELVRVWCRFMGVLRMEAPEVPLYWFLICSGFRTYLYLPLFFREFHPRHEAAPPPFEAALIDALGRRKFPEEYAAGVVRPARPRERLRPDLAAPAPHKLQNPHVRFFVERNPGYLRGDELVCVAEFSPANTLRMAREMALEGERAGGCVPDRVGTRRGAEGGT